MATSSIVTVLDLFLPYMFCIAVCVEWLPKDIAVITFQGNSTLRREARFAALCFQNNSRIHKFFLDNNGCDVLRCPWPTCRCIFLAYTDCNKHLENNPYHVDLDKNVRHQMLLRNQMRIDDDYSHMKTGRDINRLPWAQNIDRASMRQHPPGVDTWTCNGGLVLSGDCVKHVYCCWKCGAFFLLWGTVGNLKGCYYHLSTVHQDASIKNGVQQRCMFEHKNFELDMPIYAPGFDDDDGDTVDPSMQQQ